MCACVWERGGIARREREKSIFLAKIKTMDRRKKCVSAREKHTNNQSKTNQKTKKKLLISTCSVLAQVYLCTSGGAAHLQPHNTHDLSLCSSLRSFDRLVLAVSLFISLSIYLSLILCLPPLLVFVSLLSACLRLIMNECMARVCVHNKASTHMHVFTYIYIHAYIHIFTHIYVCFIHV